MTITPAAFTKTMSAFSAKIGVQLSPLMATYYESVLSHDLDTEDFLKGARIVYRDIPYTHWPSAQAFSDAIQHAAGVSPAQQAITAPVVTRRHPRYAIVKQYLGELIADAYTISNPRALFSEDDSVCQPAILEFEKALAAAVVLGVVRKQVPCWASWQSPPPPSVLLPQGCNPSGLPDGIRELYDVVMDVGQPAT